MKTEQRTVTTIIAGEGKLLRRKSDGWVAGEQVTLGYNYYEGGVGLAEAKLETPEDYEEFDRPADYESPEIIDDVQRILNGQRVLEETTKLMEQASRRMEEEREGINTLDLTDSESLMLKDFFPEWEVGIEVKTGEKYRLGEDLWKALKDHTTQENWKPSLTTASLWEKVDEDHEGTEEDPIPYTPPMEIFEGKYYSQDGKTYKCTRSSGQALTHNLSDLVGHYVELIN